MPTDYLSTSIEYLKGVGPQRADLLKKELKIFFFKDLLYFYPFRYIDRSRFHTVCEIQLDMPYIQLKGKISNIMLHGQKRATRMTAIFSDPTGQLELVWFNGIRFLKDAYKPGIEYVVFGKPNSFNGKFNIVHPEIEIATHENLTLTSELYPVYSSSEKLKTKGLDSKGISKLIKNLLPGIKGAINETLSEPILTDLKLISKEEALFHIHFPANQAALKKAQSRLKFEEFFFLQLKLLKLKYIRIEKSQGHTFSSIGALFNNFYHHHLPFELTNAQKKVIKEIRQDTATSKQMNRLLQGDVGSGKTIVAVMTILMALDNGFQACMMAPTEILAQQHYETISRLLEPLNINIKLLTGSTKSSEKKKISAALSDGSIQLIIGTHALIEDYVAFNKLGLVIIDEQHRFGVAQRARLWKKNTIPPHILVMTATPIPRTLAMTLYGDLDVSVINELPPGRKPVKTIHQYDSHRLRLFGFMKEQIKAGRQVYIVYPIIQESETLDLKDLMDGYESISRAFPLPDYATGIVHGKMKSKDKDYEMQRFLKGETQIMVATTVIEVGVNVPNASVMVIENAERFGLSQLHQLRGRVGRGADQSYCILMTSHKLTADGRLRIDTMVRTNDGFEIAEADLKLRGPGDIQGTQQSGILDLKIADIIRDEAILKIARNKAMDILESDPYLDEAHNRRIKTELNDQIKNTENWERIS